MLINVARDDSGEPEIFRSFQGEGANAGRLRTFIRLSGCNLHCVWCDTAYTWNWNGTSFVHERDAPGIPHKFDRTAETIRAETSEICARAVSLASEGFVITGGEPLMQQTALIELVGSLRVFAPHSSVEIETNGTIAPERALCDGVDLFMVSPKLAHSGNDVDLALRPQVLRGYAGMASAFFKFVARTVGDVAVIVDLAENFEIPRRRIFVMPEGAEPHVLDKRSRALAEAIATSGFSFSPRLHIHLFGNARGV